MSFDEQADSDLDLAIEHGLKMNARVAELTEQLSASWAEVDRLRNLLGQMVDVLVLRGHAISHADWEEATHLSGRSDARMPDWDRDAAKEARALRAERDVLRARAESAEAACAAMRSALDVCDNTLSACSPGTDLRPAFLAIEKATTPVAEPPCRACGHRAKTHHQDGAQRLECRERGCDCTDYEEPATEPDSTEVKP